MAEDVINNLEKMTLTTEEEEVIAVSDEGRKEEIEGCAQSLIGKFLTCRPFNKRAAMNTLKRSWGLEESVWAMEVGTNLFQFKFSAEYDLERVLRSGPWTFDNQVLLLRRWQRGMTAANVRFESVSLWVQIWGAPFDMVSPKVATEIGSRLGVVEEVEKRRRQDSQSLFMRVKVALPISKPVRRGGFLAGSDGQRTWVTFKYERLPLFCHWCGTLGHDTKHCAHYFARTKVDGEVVCQYGEWLRASGGRNRSPPRRGSSGTDQQGEANSGATEKEQKEGHDGAATVNPSDTRSAPVDKDENGKNGISGTTPTGQERIMEDDVNTGIEGERICAQSLEINSAAPNVNLEVTCELEPHHVGHVSVHGEGLKNNGPKLDKLRPTWTRLSRMDCGPNENKKSGPCTSLGKRNLAHEREQDHAEELENKPVKRGKLQNESQDSKTAGVLNHPCRAQ